MEELSDACAKVVYAVSRAKDIPGRMEITERALAGLYVVVALALASSAADAAGPEAVVGKPITCAKNQKVTSSVSQPNTTVQVTCPQDFKLEPGVSDGAKDDYYTNEQCTTKGLLSTVCPGATVATATPGRGAGTTVDVTFPQLPTSQQVVYLKCAKESEDCTAIITVEPAPPQGPQACAVPGTSVTLHVNQAGGAAQFACGKNLALAPSDPAKAYAEDCAKVETLRDMKRSDVPGNYATLKVDKLKKKRLCYLCMQGASPGKQAGQGGRCTVYVEVSGTRRLASSVLFGFTLPCLAAMLGFI